MSYNVNGGVGEGEGEGGGGEGEGEGRGGGEWRRGGGFIMNAHSQVLTCYIMTNYSVWKYGKC